MTGIRCVQHALDAAAPAARVPHHPLAEQTRNHLDSRLTASAIAGELRTLRGPHRQTFAATVRLGLAAETRFTELELISADLPGAAPWRDAVRPLANEFAERFLDYLPGPTTRPERVRMPTARLRCGSQSTGATSCSITHCGGDQRAREPLVFGRDRRYPSGYEPGARTSSRQDWSRPR